MVIAHVNLLSVSGFSHIRPDHGLLAFRLRDHIMHRLVMETIARARLSMVLMGSIGVSKVYWWKW